MVTKKKTTPKEVEMHKFTCVTCGKVNFDMNRYFKDIPSTKCFWCIKHPKDPKAKFR